MKPITTFAALSCCLGLALAVPMSFNVTNNNGTCLIFNVDYNGFLTYKLTNGTSFNITANFDRVDSNSSGCVNGKEPFVLTVMDASARNTLKHTFAPPTLANETYKLQSLVWEYSYLDVNDTVAVLAVSKLDVALHPANESYFCNSSLSVSWANKTTNASLVWLTYSLLGVQVAEIKNNTLSSNRTECAADFTSSTVVTTSTTMTSTATTTVSPSTSAPTSTPVPITTPFMPASNGSYVLTQNNKTCVVLDARIGFTVPYRSVVSKQISFGYVSLPPPDGKNVTVSGTCGNTSDTLVINFFGGWSFSVVIEKDAFGYFAVNQINLTYVPSSQFFANASANASSQTQSSGAALGWFNTSSGNFYMCKSLQSFPLGGNVSIDTAFFSLQAFANFGNATNLVGNANECVTDTPTTAAPATDNTVPIAVGAALAGLVLIVLIAYFIGRRRSRNGYQSM